MTFFPRTSVHSKIPTAGYGSSNQINLLFFRSCFYCSFNISLKTSSSTIFIMDFLFHLFLLLFYLDSVSSACCFVCSCVCGAVNGISNISWRKHVCLPQFVGCFGRLEDFRWVFVQFEMERIRFQSVRVLRLGWKSTSFENVDATCDGCINHSRII